MPARLRYYFQKAFLCPLLVGILLSILFTGLIFINYTSKLETNDELIPIFRDIENKINKPYIETTSALLFKQFQPMINNLILFKKFYQSLKSMDKATFPDTKQAKDAFIEKYSHNGFYAFTNYTNLNETISKEGDVTLLDHGIWIRDRKTTKLKDMDNPMSVLRNINPLTKEQLFLVTNMIPIFRSVMENKGDQESNGIKQIFMAFENTELFYIYPMKSSENSYKFFNSSTYPTYCHTPSGSTVDYYFFKCQPWWKEILLFKSANNFNVSITMPYNYASDNSKGISICVRFDDDSIFKQGKKDITNTNIAICIDSYIDQINFTLDYFSKNLNGYFFIMRLNSDVPIYYPLTSYKNGHTSISNYEFDFNVTYFLNELDEFKSIKKDFSSMINFIEPKDENDFEKQKIKGSYFKNKLKHNYEVIPIPLFLDEDNPTNRTHFFSIVLVTSDKSGLDFGATAFSNSRIATLIIVLAFFGLILLLIGKYLINALADNIVRPLRSLKFIIQGMNNKQILEDKEYTKQEEEIDSKVAREDADISFERTHEIEVFGEMIIKLQNVLKFTTNNKNTSDSLALMKYVYSKYSFQEVFNIKGKNLCDSNVGNLALRCSKYDKAIFHINIALQKELKIVEQMERNKKKLKNKQKTVVNSETNILLKNTRVPINSNSVEAKRNKLLESRYPKLIYAYKKFYKNLNRILKEQNEINKIHKEDFFVGDRHHSLENYEDTVKSYLDWAKSTRDARRISEALLEYNDFLINYKVGLNTENPSEQMMKNKELCIKMIIRNFYEFDQIFEKHKTSNEAITNLKILYDKIRSSKKNNFDLIEVPIEILMQKSNYLKGKFMKLNQDYRAALEFFYHSQKVNVVCCAKIVKQSIKQIIKIYKLMIENINKIEVISENDQYYQTYSQSKGNTKNQKKDKDAELRQKHKEQFQKHIDKWNIELNKYTYFSKDYSILINISKSINENQKKIDRALKISDSIYENFITSKDRFSLFLVSKSANPIINLSYKNFQTYEFIKDSIASVKDLIEDNGFSKDSESNLIKAIVKAREYLNKRSKIKYLKNLGYDGSEKWVLVITDNVNENELELLRRESIQTVFGPNSKDHIALIGIGMNPEYKDILRDSLDYNKNCYVDYDHLEKLKNNLRISGEIKEQTEFTNEIYESNDNL